MNYDCVTSVGRGKGDGWTVVSAILDRRHTRFLLNFLHTLREVERKVGKKNCLIDLQDVTF